MYLLFLDTYFIST